MLDADAHMRLLIPDGKIEDVAKALNLSPSLIYQERRPYGLDKGQTGTRNCISRLDTIATLALSHTPEAVLMLGRRYTDMHANALAPVQHVTEKDLLEALARTSTEVGQAMSKLIGAAPSSECSVEVAQAEEWLQRSLNFIKALKAQSNVC